MKLIARMVIVACALVALVGLVHAQGAQSGYDLLQQALVAERSNGQVREAIELYRRIISEHASDRALTATALVRLGRAYETLGSQDARQTYERVVSEYADQRDMASEARARLSAIARSRTASAAKTMAARQVWTDPGDFGGRVSPDGRYVSFADWNTGNLAIHDVVTGEDRQVTSGGSFGLTVGNFAEESRWSPDSTQLAYTRYVNVEQSYELRLTGIDSLESRLLYRDDDVQYPYPGGWSPDGQSLSISLQHLDGTYELGVLSVADGAVRILKSLDRSWCGCVGPFSPDGEYFVYSHGPDETSQNKDLFLMAVDGSREVQLTDTPADDDMLGWAPDGSLLFKSNRTGRYALWRIRVEDGTPVGSAVMLLADLGDVKLMGTTPDGALYYGVDTNAADAFTVAFDPDIVEVVGPPTTIDSSFQGATAAPAWSADGKYLAFRLRRGPEDLLVIRSLESGGETVATREIRVPNRCQCIQWHSDGGSVFVYGQHRGRRGVFEVDLRTDGAVPRFVEERTRASERPGNGAVVSADGTTMYAVQRERSPDREIVRAAIVRTDLATGVESELYATTSPQSIGTEIALSPDNQTLLFVARTDDLRSLSVISTTGGRPRHLTDLVYRGENTLSAGNGLAWTPDGDNVLLFGRCCGVQQLFRVSATGGELEPAGLVTMLPREADQAKDPDVIF